jgi:hypothetical protein
MSDLQKGKVWNEDEDWVAGLDGYALESHSLHGSDKHKVQGTKTTARLYNSHALNRIASDNELITSWRAPPAATSASLLPSGFVEEDDIISSSGYLDASSPIACIVIYSSP